MHIQLSNASERPIYKQITEQFKQAILSGSLPPGSALPSIRMLAKDLKISVMTTKRAYADLERDGFIETVAGKGSFVAARNQDFLREELLKKVEFHLLQAIAVAKTADITEEEVKDYINTLWEE